MICTARREKNVFRFVFCLWDDNHMRHMLFCYVLSYGVQYILCSVCSRKDTLLKVHASGRPQKICVFTFTEVKRETTGRDIHGSRNTKQIDNNITTTYHSNVHGAKRDTSARIFLRVRTTINQSESDMRTSEYETIKAFLFCLLTVFRVPRIFDHTTERHATQYQLQDNEQTKEYHKIVLRASANCTDKYLE